MKIKINDQRKIFSLQEEFNAAFPYLKLELVSKTHDTNGSSSKKHYGKTLNEYRTLHNAGQIIITSSMTVAELEQNFREVYGLEIQLLRKSGKAWLETTVTESWTLEEQNSQGEALSKDVDP